MTHQRSTRAVAPTRSACRAKGKPESKMGRHYFFERGGMNHVCKLLICCHQATMMNWYHQPWIILTIKREKVKFEVMRRPRKAQRDKNAVSALKRTQRTSQVDKRGYKGQTRLIWARELYNYPAGKSLNKSQRKYPASETPKNYLQ